MAETGEAEPKIGAIVGAYRVLEYPDKARLKRLEFVEGDYTDTSRLIFEGSSEATHAAHALSRFSSDNSSKHFSEYDIGIALRAMVSGGENATFKLYRVDVETGQKEEKPLLVATSRKELEEGLPQYFGEKK